MDSTLKDKHTVETNIADNWVKIGEESLMDFTPGSIQS